MRHLIACLFGLSLLVSVVSAQVLQQPVYTVQPDDTLWVLEGMNSGDPAQWRRLVGFNPFLQEPGRIFEDSQGRTIALIRPGEQLFGLDQLGILPTVIPASELRLATPQLPTVIREEIPVWLFWVLVAAGALLLAAWLFNRTLNADAATGGLPFVAGGVRDDETATRRFHQMGERARERWTGSGSFRIREQIAGRIWGVMRILYADGSERISRFNGDRAYRANVTYPNGTEGTLYMLQACGNDLLYSGISRYIPGAGFRFEPDMAATEPTPRPEPVRQAEPQPAVANPGNPTPVPVNPGSSEGKGPELEDGEYSIELRSGDPQAGDDRVYDMVRFKGLDVSDVKLMNKQGELTIRFKRS